MKILYGVQGTGNGHISRASAMAEEFKAYSNVEITWLLSGREKNQGCGGITKFIWRKGLTFVSVKGKISIILTLLKNNVFRYFWDAIMLDLNAYDVIICDFEPVVALAAKLKGRKILGIGHQYAFDYNIPKKGEGVVSAFLMKFYAPVTTPVGLHWNHYGAPILPPIIDLRVPLLMPDVVENKVIVYFPFESIKDIQEILKNIKNFDFYIYHPKVESSDSGNLHYRAISRVGFKNDLITAKKVMVNSGFELISECLQLGKQILAKPLHGQMEQCSNAFALEKLNYASIMENLNEQEMKSWLEADIKPMKINFPNVSSALAEWIAGGCKETIEDLSCRLWHEVQIGL